MGPSPPAGIARIDPLRNLPAFAAVVGQARPADS